VITVAKKKVVKKKKKVIKKVTKKKKKVEIYESLQNDNGGHTSVAQFVEALRAGGGYLSQAAKTLGITRQAVSQRVKRSARLQELLEDIKETYLDLAESKLIKGVDNGEAWAIKYYLNTQGKKRGYVERHELTGAEGKPIPLLVKVKRAERI